MPPVLGPRRRREPLEVLGGLQRVDDGAVGDREQRHLGAVEELLDHHPVAARPRGRRASSRSSVTTTPLPAASPSSFTTYGGAERVEGVGRPRRRWRRRGPSRWARRRRPSRPWRRPWSPRARRPRADGPKQRIPRVATASATPATSGASGPTTTRSAPSDVGQRGHRLAVERVDVVQGRRPRRCRGCRARRAPR